MGGPTKQHFIPRSYLHNFATIEGDKEFVEVLRKKTGEVIPHFSTKNVCVSTDLYTIPGVEERRKYVLETYYAENIDGVYPEVYKLLTDDSVIDITEEQRAKILYTCLSLFFRSDRFLEANHKDLDRQLDRMRSFNVSDTAILHLDYKGRHYSFMKSEFDEIRNRARIDNRLDFLVRHLQDWQDFVKSRTVTQITVNTILDDVPLVTCDNPVDIHTIQGEAVNIFSPNNVIQLPLNSKQLLWIGPVDDNSARLTIFRGVRDKMFALASNDTCEKRASTWIIGAEGTLQAHKDLLDKHTPLTSENLKVVEDTMTLGLKMQELLKVMEKTGVRSEETREKLKEVKGIPAVAKDPMFQLLVKEIEGL